MKDLHVGKSILRYFYRWGGSELTVYFCSQGVNTGILETMMKWYKVTQLIMSQSCILCKSTLTRENNSLSQISYLVFKHILCDAQKVIFVTGQREFQQLIYFLRSFWTTFLQKFGLLPFLCTSKFTFPKAPQHYWSFRVVGFFWFFFLLEVPGFQQFAYTPVAGRHLSPSCNKAGEDEQSIQFSRHRHCFKLKS